VGELIEELESSSSEAVVDKLQCMPLDGLSGHRWPLELLG